MIRKSERVGNTKDTRPYRFPRGMPRIQSPRRPETADRRRLKACGGQLPHFKSALLVIEEYSDVDGRHIFDQDNKGWKAVSNAIKGRVIPDDDQYTLSVALLSTRSCQNVCHITVLDMKDAPDFFSARAGDYSVTGLY